MNAVSESCTLGDHHSCGQCADTFRSRPLLARHVNQMHRPAKKYPCSDCSSAFNSLKNITLHRAIHSSKPFKCPKCAIIFRRHATLVGHIERHYVTEDQICAVCDREFRSLEELKSHVNEGHDEHLKRNNQPTNINVIREIGRKVFPCTICENKVFKKRSLLERHFMIHTKQKPFMCDTCGKSFNQKSSLKKHLLTHSKVQKYVCLLCGLKFSQKVNLRVHTVRVHPKRNASLGERLPCPYCPCLFKKLGSLNAHKTKMHATLLSEPIVEEHCTASDVSSEVATATILRSEPGIICKCGTCGICLQDVVQLQKHMDSHTMVKSIPESRNDQQIIPQVVQPIVVSRSHEHLQGSSEQRRYSCTVCPAAFKKSSHLKQHVKSHYGIKGNRCEICDKTFTTSHTLKVHRNSHNQNSQLHYKCSQCTARFSLQSSLLRHAKLHDNPDRNRHDQRYQISVAHVSSVHPEVETDGLSLTPTDAPINQDEIHELDEITHTEKIQLVDVSDETLIDFSNLPPNVSIVDISNLTNCIVRIGDQLYEIPVQIETNDAGDDMQATEPRYFAFHDDTAATGLNPLIDEGTNFETTDDALYQYINQTFEDTPAEGVDMVEANVSESCSAPVSQKKRKNRQSKMSNITEEELFSEVVVGGKKKYGCKGCERIFKRPVDLRRHIRTHTGERPFPCTQCPKSFTLKGVLQSHMQTHITKREMLHCSEEGCNGKFSSKSSLELHRRIHTGDRPFRCTVCSLTFRTSGHMKAHLTSHLRLKERQEQNH
ncbi:zinc finger protein 678-like [Topomyia yanbarensis]|uniref:zinc finger protein 678-like n=1 Tax=Topomyia yanbarensis TaxID=2498891 RepID=UPI00273AD15A|nr:zinc finger protein 678-like [Topomyia yanbarensis]XP_058814624.1 zinc finger protein 678-like [Topomyia yanbarensis]XP_058814625.1 zinc finger protein 678-like [Topomyia yanbarensis]